MSMVKRPKLLTDTGKHRCCICGLKGNMFGVPMFKPPNDYLCLKKWKKCLKIHPEEEIPQTLRVCGRHFTPESIRNNKRCYRLITKIAVPRLQKRETWNEMFEETISLATKNLTDAGYANHVIGAYKFAGESGDNDEIVDMEPEAISAISVVVDSSPRSQHGDSVSIKIEAQDEAEVSPFVGQNVATVAVDSSADSNASVSTSTSAHRPLLDASNRLTTDESSSANTVAFGHNNNRYIVCEANLAALFKTCLYKNCYACICEKRAVYRGALLTVLWTCQGGHRGVWNSHDIATEPVDSRPTNAELTAAIFTSGSTFKQFDNVAKVLNLKILSDDAFYAYQDNMIAPTILTVYRNHRKELIRSIQERQQVDGCAPGLTIAVDGQYDSPESSAIYCNVSAMDLSSKKILDYSLLALPDPSLRNSGTMECDGIRKLLKYFSKKQMKIASVCTDQNLQIGTIMAKEFPKIDHQINVLDLAKNFKKQLMKLSIERNCSEIRSWSNQLQNHLIYSCQKCVELSTDLGENDKQQLLVEIMRSSLKHARNEHQWISDTEYRFVHRCYHNPLSDDKLNETAWLRENSVAYQRLVSLINDEIVPLLRHCTSALCMSDLESFHNVRLKYTPKLRFFKHRTYSARTALAVLDHNANCERPIIYESGEPVTRTKWSKVRNDWRPCAVREPKSYKWRAELIQRCIEVSKDERYAEL